MAGGVMLSDRTVRHPVRMEEDDGLFRLQLGFLSRGSATEAGGDDVTLQPVDEQAKKLVHEMAQRVRAGALTPTMSRLLADYLDALDETAQWRLLGLSRSSRRLSGAGQKSSAVYAYTAALERGLEVDEALIHAYDAYYSAAPCEPGCATATFAKDSEKMLAQKSRHGTVAAQRMATTVKPALVQAGVLKPGPVGRPRKSK